MLNLGLMSESPGGNEKLKSWSEQLAELPSRIFKSEAKLVIAAAAAGIAAFAYGQSRLEAKNAEQIDAGITPIEKRLKIVEQRQQEQGSDIHEVQADIRALYKAVMTGQPQPRLEVPHVPLDGGQ
ncbi:hypothetical protein [Caudoviricetes sp.]|nr:hypothetical protein [Caudoviricetes sp.]